MSWIWDALLSKRADIVAAALGSLISSTILLFVAAIGYFLKLWIEMKMQDWQNKKNDQRTRDQAEEQAEAAIRQAEDYDETQLRNLQARVEFVMWPGKVKEMTDLLLDFFSQRMEQLSDPANRKFYQEWSNPQNQQSFRLLNPSASFQEQWFEDIKNLRYVRKDDRKLAD